MSNISSQIAGLTHPKNKSNEKIAKESRTRQAQLMAMIIWTKKKFKQIYQYRAKGTYCGYMGDHKEIKKQHSF